MRVSVLVVMAFVLMFSCGTDGLVRVNVRLDPALCVAVEVQWEQARTTTIEEACGDLDTALRTLERLRNDRISAPPVIRNIYERVNSGYQGHNQ